MGRTEREREGGVELKWLDKSGILLGKDATLSPLKRFEGLFQVPRTSEKACFTLPS